MEAKRRLPLWMAGASIADKVSKPVDAAASNVITKEEVTESTKPKAKALTRKHKKEVCLPSDGTSFLVKCETKIKKRGFVDKDVIKHHNPEQEVVVEKRKRGRVGRKVEESDPSRKNEKRSDDFESSNENQAPSCDEEDDDLTMEDILSIAKELVGDDKIDMGQQPSEGQCNLKDKPSNLSSSVTRTSLSIPQDTKSPIHGETTSHHEFVENTTSKVTLADSIMTGDSTQDMLDLFLGPLLRKPIGKEETSSIKDIILPHEVKNQQHDVIPNKPVTFTKKKSSLRDAVAMLLD